MTDVKRFKISSFLGTKDYEMFLDVINGVRFELSTFDIDSKNGKLDMYFAYSEKHLIIEQLKRINTENSLDWVEIINNKEYVEGQE